MRVLTLISAAVLFLAANNFKMSAQEPEVKEYTRLLFWVEDSAGNRDSCWFIGRPDASEGVDEHLGEINLFGIPPQNELDIRIIQRTDDNHNGCWLYGRHHWSDYSGYVLSFSENIDLKVDHRWEPQWSESLLLYFDVTTVVLEITAVNYPVNVYVEYDPETGCGGYVGLTSHYFLHEKNGDGKCVGYHWISPAEIGENGEYVCHKINSAAENYWMSFALNEYMRVGIQEELPNVFILPNPAGNFVLIEGLINEELRLYDANGNLIRSFIVSESPYRLDISNISIGVYNVANRNGQLLGRFIKGGN